MNASVRVASVMACLLVGSVIGCQSQTEQAAAPKPLKPNVSPSAPSEPKDFASADLVPDKPAGDPAASIDSDLEINKQPNVAPAQAAQGGSLAETTDPAEPNTVAEAPASEIPLVKPTVVMSEAHRNTCTVFTGDKFPSLKVQTLAGEAVDTGELLDEAFNSGKRLAVVVLWKADEVYAREQYERLTEELIGPYDEAGVKVVAIHVGGQPADVEAVPFQPADAATSLIDPNETAFASLATGKLPRTYLLAADGTILWLDLEYSRGTRRDLRNAIVYHLTMLADAAE